MSAPLLDMTLLIDLGMIFVLATVLSYIARIFKQPSLIAYIAAGMILGPIGLGAMGITIGGVPIGVSAIGNDIKILSELGIAFLLFSVGVESNFSKLKDLGRVVLAGGILQVVITALAVFLLSMHFQLVGFAEAVYIGLIVAFSSTIIVVKLLSDSHTINTLHGRILIGILLVQDMLVILAMPLLANLDQVLSMQAFFPVLAQGVFIIALAYLLNKYAYPRIFNFATQSDDLFYHVAISSCFIFIGIAYVLNFSIAIGAFIAGLSISTLPYNLEVYNRVRGVRDLFATVFFVTLGMQITLSFAAIPLGLILVVLGAVFFLKPLILYLITLFSGFGGRVSLMVALGLAQVSEFSFILLSQGEQANVFQTPGLYSFLLLVIAASMVITPYSMQYSTRIYSLFNRLFSGYAQPFKHKALYRRIHKMESVPKGLNNHIIIVGGGTMGYSVAAALKDTHDLVVLDHDSERVFKCMGRGINAIYGSADNTEVLRRINLSQARLLILALPAVKASRFLIEYAKRQNPKIVVFARAHFAKDALDFYRCGADFVVMPHIIGSNVFLREVAKFLEFGRVSYISNYKDEFLKYLKENVAEDEKHMKI